MSALLVALAGCSQLEQLLSSYPDGGTGGVGGTGTGGGGGTGAGGAGGMAPASPPGSGGCAACPPFVTLQSGELQTSITEAMTFTVRVCRADACGTVALTPTQTTLIYASFESNGGSDDVEVSLTSFDGPLRVKADWMYRRRARFLAGDVYLLEVRDRAGQLVTSVRKRAVSAVDGSDPWVCAVTCPKVVLEDLPR